MGGVHTDLHGRTPLEGLFAAGETACVSINGANRLGSNSLTELLVFGARAGRAAAEYVAASDRFTAAVQAQALDEERRLRTLVLGGRGKESVAGLRGEMQRALEQGAGIYRDRAGLAAAASKIADLKARFEDVRVDDHSRTFNTELVACLELSNMLDVAEAVVHSALERAESRGAHQRTDHPARDDARYLAHSLAHRATHGPPRIEYQPVTITRWPPAERVYGR
jgi:fumarate reductase flavoprotein subunit